MLVDPAHRASRSRRARRSSTSTTPASGSSAHPACWARSDIPAVNKDPGRLHPDAAEPVRHDLDAERAGQPITTVLQRPIPTGVQFFDQLGADPQAFHAAERRRTAARRARDGRHRRRTHSPSTDRSPQRRHPARDCPTPSRRTAGANRDGVGQYLGCWRWSCDRSTGCVRHRCRPSRARRAAVRRRSTRLEGLRGAAPSWSKNCTPVGMGRCGTVVIRLASTLGVQVVPNRLSGVRV